MDKIQGKHFSITDPQGVDTVIYRVNKTPRELLQEYPKFTVQRLEYAEELNGNLKKKTFPSSKQKKNCQEINYLIS